MIGLMVSCAPDFQHNKQLAILSKAQERYCFEINQGNLIQFCIYYSVRHCLDPTWLNDRDQFLHPNDGWQTDTEFQNDCLAYTLFSNNIQSSFGTNHWIPFTEQEVNARDKFASNFMTQFIQGKLPQGLFDAPSNRTTPLAFSAQAQAVFDAGSALWKYYHQLPNCNVNASLYDIREHFQGRNDKGKMNNKSADETYMSLIKALREQLKLLQKTIAPKIYEYGFLK